MPSFKKKDKENVPSPLPFRSEKFAQDRKKRKDRIYRAIDKAARSEKVVNGDPVLEEKPLPITPLARKRHKELDQEARREKKAITQSQEPLQKEPVQEKEALEPVQEKEALEPVQEKEALEPVQEKETLEPAQEEPAQEEPDLSPVKPIAPQKKRKLGRILLSREPRSNQASSSLPEIEPIKPRKTEKTSPALEVDSSSPRISRRGTGFFSRVIGFFRGKEARPLPEEIRPIRPQEVAKRKSVNLKQPTVAKAQKSNAGQPRKASSNNSSGATPGVISDPEAKELVVAKKGSSKSLPEEPGAREAERLMRERNRQKRQSARRRRKTKHSDRKVARTKIRDRSKERRAARRKAQEERARQRSEAISLAVAGKSHWSKGIPVLGPFFEKRNSKDVKKAQPTFAVKVEEWRRAFRARQAQKVWQDIAGMDIGASFIRVAMIQEGKVFLAEREIPDGIIVDGILAEPEELTEEIRTLWKDSEIPSNKVNFSFENNLAVVRTLDLSAGSEDDVRQAIALNAAPLVQPMSPSNVAIDYAELSRAGADVSLQIAAADEEMVSEFVRAIENAGLVAAGAELGPLALKRAIRIPRKPGKAQVLLDVGAETTSFLVASGPDAFFWRSLDTAGNDFTGAVAAATGLSWIKAEELKKSLPEDMDVFSEEQLQAYQAIQKVTDRLAQEIIQTEKLYGREGAEHKIVAYQLLGGGSHLRGLQEQLHFTLEKPVLDRPESALPLGSQDLDLNDWGQALGLASGHQMSLIPPRVDGMFRKKRITSKISSADTASRSRQLTAARQNQVALTRARILVPLAIAIGLMVPWAWGSELKKEADLLREEQKSLQGVKEPEAPQARPLPAPVWNNLGKSLAIAESSDIEILEYNSSSSESEIFIRDFRTPKKLNELFKSTGGKAEIAPSGEIIIRIGERP